MTKVATPLRLHNEPVRPEWIDYNGHMNVAYYVLAFDHATDALFDLIDVGEGYRQRHDASMFAVEAHIRYEREIAEGDPMAFASTVIAADEKRIHFAHEMFHGTAGWRAATLEQLALHIDMSTRRVAPFPEKARTLIADIAAAHQAAPPDFLCGAIGLRRSTQ